MAQTDDLFAQALKAYEQGDYQLVKSALHRLLSINVRHKEAWRLLYRCSGESGDFQSFVTDYVRRYFPHLLPRGPAQGLEGETLPSPAAPVEKLQTEPAAAPPPEPAAAIAAAPQTAPFTYTEYDEWAEMPATAAQAAALVEWGEPPAFLVSSCYPFDVKLVSGSAQEMVYGLYHGSQRFVDVRILLNRRQYFICFQEKPVYSLEVTEARQIAWYGSVDTLRYLKLPREVELGTSFFDGQYTHLIPHSQLKIEKFLLALSGEKESFTIVSQDTANLPVQASLLIQHTRTFLGRNDQYWLTVERDTGLRRYDDPLEELLFLELVRQAVIKYNTLPPDKLLP